MILDCNEVQEEVRGRKKRNKKKTSEEIDFLNYLLFLIFPDKDGKYN